MKICVTSNPDIFALGDSVEVPDLVSGERTLMPLSDQVNRQGRIVAEVLAGINSHYRGIQRISGCSFFNTAVAQTGMNEKALTRKGDFDFDKICLNHGTQAGRYPRAKTKAVKITFRKSDGRLLGAQVIGGEGVAARIEAYAMAIRMGSTIFDLRENHPEPSPCFKDVRDPSDKLLSGKVLKFT